MRMARSVERMLTGMAALAALLGAGPALAIEVPVRMTTGQLVVAELKASGIGSGQAQVQTGDGTLTVRVDQMKPVPDCVFVFALGGGAQLLQFMGGGLTDMSDFETRLVFALSGRPVPAAQRVEASARDTLAAFNPAAAMADRGKAAPRKKRPPKKQAKPSRGSGGGGGSKIEGKSFKVLATAEGLIGGRTASGMIIQKWSMGVALPSREALKRKTHVVYLKNKRAIDAPVLDVGPWNINDPYWRTTGHPQAESGRDRSGRRTNKAGLDIFNAGWYELLGLRTYDKSLIERTSGMVEWGFTN